jgi:hypothetical protein
MQYLMMVCVDETKTAPEPGEDASVEPWVEEMDGKGLRLAGDRTRPQSDWTTVKIRNGELLVSDGPFVETKEYVAGFDLLECANLDEAIEVASKHPMAKAGVLELRPVWPFAG